MSHFDGKEKRTLTIFIFIFVLLTAGIAIGGYLSYRNYEAQFRAQAEHQLSSIAELKMNELVNWRKERMADAELLHQSAAFATLAQSYFENPQDALAQAQVQAWLDSYQVFPDYNRVRLLDPQGQTRLSDPGGLPPISSMVAKHIPEVLQSKQVTLVDFYRRDGDGQISLCLLIPILDAQTGNQAIGLVALSINPQTYLYPFIQSWPVPSTSAETLLIRREGNEALYLNELRFNPDAALTLRFPLTETELPAVKAVLGQSGVVEGADYRGEPVLADVRAVPGSPWFLVSKMGIAEIYVPLKARLQNTFWLIGAAIFVVGTGLVTVWRQQRTHYYRAQIEAAESLRASEEKFRQAFNTSPIAISISRVKGGGFVSVNKSFEQMSGYSEAEIIGETAEGLNLWKSPQVHQDLLKELRDKGEVRDYETPILTRNGEMYCLTSASIIKINGEPHILTLAVDITERKRAEDELRVALIKYKTLFDCFPQGITVSDEAGNILETNAAAGRLLSVPGEEQARHGIDGTEWEIVRPDGTPMPPEEFASVKALKEKRVIENVEMGIVKPDNSITWISVNAAPLPVEGYGVVVTYGDISERKWAEEALHESEELFRQVYEYMEVGVARVSPDFCIQSANQAYCRMLGYSEAELTGKHLGDITHPEVLEENLRKQAQLAAGEIDHYRMEKRFIHRDGHVVYGILDSSLIRDAQGKPSYFLSSVLDITERKRAEEELRRSEAQYRLLAENMSDTVWLMDMNLKTVYISPSVVRLRGFTLEEINSIPLDQQMTAESLQRVMLLFVEALSPGNLSQPSPRIAYSIELEFHRKDGTHFWSENTFTLVLDSNGQPVNILGSGRDITERKRAKQQLANYTEKLEVMVDERTRELREAHEQLVRQERLATLGQLAGSIGHELRNPLGVISNAVYFLKMSQPDASDKVREYLDIIGNEARTSDKIVTDLLDFTRVKSLDRQPAAISELVRQTLERYPVPPSVEVVLEIAPHLPPVYADPQHVVQILGNLVANACQSMPDGGNLILSASVQGDMIAIAVQDTGEGIPPDNMKKLFEPLFTTKIKGIGLGLAVSKKLAEANGGRIEVQSEPGAGSTFTLWLPCYPLPN